LTVIETREFGRFKHFFELLNPSWRQHRARLRPHISGLGGAAIMSPRGAFLG